MCRVKVVAALILGAVLLAGGASAEQLKVGFVYVGPIGDHGWTYRHNECRLAVEKAYGDKVATAYVESVQEGADAERVIRSLAADGNRLIFTTSFGFMNPTIKVAKQFPDVMFEHATGYKRAGNVSTYMARFYEGRHLAGLIAGKVSKSGIVGYIASFPIPEVIRGINAFTLAMRSVNPEAVVRPVWVNTWYDPGKEAAAAKALIDQGADVILQHTDSPAPIQTAEERGVWAVGQASDMRRFGPKAQLTAVINDWNGYCVDRVKAVMDGTWRSHDMWGGLDAGMLRMAEYNEALPADVIEMAERAEAGIAAGERHPFSGPIRNQEGREVVAAGRTLDDKALLSMDWYVEGVEGSLPK